MTNKDAIAILEDCLNKAEYKYGAYGIALRMAMQALKATTWIPCSDKMPKNGTYLCTVCGWGGEYLRILGYSKNLYKVDKFDFWDKKGKAGFYELDSEYGFHEVHDVVAWMPLPEAYKGEEE